MIDGKTGFLVPQKDAVLMALKAEQILLDSNLHDSMSKNSIEQAKKFSLDKQVDNFLAFYEEVIEDFEARKSLTILPVYYWKN